MKYRFLSIAVILGLSFAASLQVSSACDATGFNGLTAALVNPTYTVSGAVNATGCNMGVYFDHGDGDVENAEIYGSNYYGVFVNGDTNTVSVNISESEIHDIGETPLNGSQHGVAIYYRAYFLGGSASGKISGNTIYHYQKGGIVTNGQGTSVVVTDNTVTGEGPVSYIAQNGIQVGYGASASVMRNTVTGNSYTGTSTASGGIIVVGGMGYLTCPDGNSCPYTVGTRIVGNTVRNNDIGIWLSNLMTGNPDYLSPTSATNVKAVNNIISSAGLYNMYGGFGYQAGVADQGNNDKIINNSISGSGYDPNANPSAYTVPIDADTSFTNRPKVHANAFDGEKTN
jgi:Right handed beta helix region